MKLPIQPVNHSWDNTTASVQFNIGVQAMTKREHPRLYIQVTDSYGFQRELIIQAKYDGHNVRYYDLLLGVHPVRRVRKELTKHVGEAIIARILELSGKYPALFFNAPDANHPRCRGFVVLHERLMGSEVITVSMVG